jgi:hypothetical protein
MAEARRAVSYLEFYEDCGGEISAWHCNNLYFDSNLTQNQSTKFT